MRFLPAFDLHAVPLELLRAVQPGQYVTASGAKGRFWGVARSGVVVVAWSKKTREQHRALRAYAAR